MQSQTEINQVSLAGLMRGQYTYSACEIGILSPDTETFMSEDSDRNRRSPPRNLAPSRITTWVKICAAILAALIVLKWLDLQVFVRLDFDDEPVFAALTEIETYYIPLGLLLVYLVIAWLWDLYFGPKDD